MKNKEFICPVSLTVCVTASLLHFSRVQKGDYDFLNEDNFRRIQEYATHYLSEISSEFGISDVHIWRAHLAR